MNQQLIISRAHSQRADQGPTPQSWRRFYCIICPEAVNIDCPSNKLPRDSSTNTVVPIRTQRELGLGVYMIALQMSLTCGRVPRETDPIKMQQATTGSGGATDWKNWEDIAGSTGWWVYFSFFLLFPLPICTFYKNKNLQRLLFILIQFREAYNKISCCFILQPIGSLWFLLWTMQRIVKDCLPMHSLSRLECFGIQFLFSC